MSIESKRKREEMQKDSSRLKLRDTVIKKFEELLRSEDITITKEVNVEFKEGRVHIDFIGFFSLPIFFYITLDKVEENEKLKDWCNKTNNKIFIYCIGEDISDIEISYRRAKVSLLYNGARVIIHN